LCKTTNPSACKHGGDFAKLLRSFLRLVSRRLQKIKDMETQMFLKKAKSVKEAVFGRSTWLVRRGQQERKERKKWR